MISHLTFNKPVLLIGNGVRMAEAVDLVHQLSIKSNIPILTTMNGVDLAQDSSHIGFIGTHGNRIANMIISECDLIIAIGARLGIRQVGKITANFAPKAKLVRVDVDQYELSRVIKDDEIQYRMDAKKFLIELLKENIGDYFEWKNKCFKAKKILDDYDKTEGNFCIEKISSILPENPIVAVDVGQNQCWTAQSLLLRGNGGRILIGGGYGSMGCGLPYAIGASIAINRGKVFCISGDGGFQMNIQELETVKRDKLPIKIFILNNKVLGKISETQHFNHEDRYAQTTKSSGYSVPDFAKIATAYGIKATTLNSYNELENFIDWMEDDEPCLININLSPESYLVPKIKFETGIIEPRLKDDTLQEVLYILKN